jgi:hypothetical protein
MADEHRLHKQRLREAKEKASKGKTAQLANEASKPKTFFDISEEEELEMSKNGGLVLWNALLDRVAREKGEVLVATLMGSTRYNLQVQGSDMDLVVVYLPPLKDNIGIKPQPQTFKQNDNCRPDFSIHSLGHFCTLISEGDAKSIEVLFGHSSIEHLIDSDWTQLRAWKSRFVTKRFIRNYTGELQGLKGLKKLKKLIEDDSDPISIKKCAYILMRLILLARRFISAFEAKTLDSSNPTWFEDGTNDHFLLISMRRGEIAPLKLQELILKEASSLDLFLASSALPESLDPVYSTELEQWYLLFCEKRYHMSLEPILQPTESILPIGCIPGHLLCLYRNPCDNSLFGVYSQHLKRKLSYQSRKEQDGVISGLVPSNAIEGSSMANQKYTVYELDRLTDAIRRDELTTVIALQNNLERVYCTSAWVKFDEFLQLLWTNSLLYQLCGYLSGRFKACRGEANLLRNDTTGFMSPMALSVSQFASKLLAVALSDESPRQVSSSEARVALEGLLKSVSAISAVCASLLNQTATAEQLSNLSEASQTYTKTFISLRPILSELLWPGVNFEKLEPWFIECRLEPYKTREAE